MFFDVFCTFVAPVWTAIWSQCHVSLLHHWFGMVWTIIPVRMLARFNGFFVHLVMSQRHGIEVLQVKSSAVTGCFPLVLRLCELQDQQKGRVCSFGLPVVYSWTSQKTKRWSCDNGWIHLSSQCIYSQFVCCFRQIFFERNPSARQPRRQQRLPTRFRPLGVFQVIGSIDIDWMMSRHGFV